MRNIFYTFLLLSPVTFAQVPSDAPLFDRNWLIKKAQSPRTLDPLSPPLPNEILLKNLLNKTSRDQSIENRVLQLTYVDSQRPCDEFQNPIMQKREWIDLLNESFELVKEQFSDGLEANPQLKLALLRDLETMKSDPSCVNGPNQCRLKLRANLELYTGVLAPNYPKENFSPTKKMPDLLDVESQEKMKDSLKIYQESMKIFSEARAVGKNYDFAKIFETKSLEHWYQVNRGQIPKDLYKDEGAVLYAKAYKGRLVDIQNILAEKKGTIDDQLGALIKPRLGGEKYDSQRPYCQAIDFPNPPDFFSLKNCMLVEIPLPKEKPIVVPCVEKISLREEHKIDINFNTGSDVIENPEDFRSKVLAIFEDVKRRGYTVTGYQILASSSQIWGKNTPPEEAKKKNLDLSSRRAVAGQKVVDAIPGFSELDHIPADKLALDDGVTEQKLQKINVNVLGPTTVPAGLTGSSLSDENKKKLYESLKSDFDLHGLFPTEQEYFDFLAQKKMTNVKDATFKPFQFFKIVVEGRKTGEAPCHGAKASGAANSSHQKAIGQ
jgi:hypothetical protein